MQPRSPTLTPSSVLARPVGAAVMFGDSITDGYEERRLRYRRGPGRDRRRPPLSPTTSPGACWPCRRPGEIGAERRHQRRIACSTDGQHERLTGRAGCAALSTTTSSAWPASSDAIVLEGINDIAAASASAEQVTRGCAQIVAARCTPHGAARPARARSSRPAPALASATCPACTSTGRAQRRARRRQRLDPQRRRAAPTGSSTSTRRLRGRPAERARSGRSTAATTSTRTRSGYRAGGVGGGDRTLDPEAHPDRPDAERGPCADLRIGVRQLPGVGETARAGRPGAVVARQRSSRSCWRP